MNKLTTKEFIEKAKKVHSNKYDYSKAEYIDAKTKVCIICFKHGEFWQTPSNHLKGRGCLKCGLESMASLQTKTTEEFIEKAKIVHGGKYDYSNVEYKNVNKKICITCPTHGYFWQKPSNHLNGQGCPCCYGNLRKTTSQFINDARKIHGNKYDYSKVEYVNNRTKVCIICQKHGEFWQEPHGHLKGKGCTYCKESKLEIEVANLLLENGINFIRECGICHFKWLGRLTLDFYLPQYNIAIECQGRQHFDCDEFFGGKKSFLEQLRRDEDKARKCHENGIKLIYYTKPSFKPLYKAITDKQTLLNVIKK